MISNKELNRLDIEILDKIRWQKNPTNFMVALRNGRIYWTHKNHWDKTYGSKYKIPYINDGIQMAYRMDLHYDN